MTHIDAFIHYIRNYVIRDMSFCLRRAAISVWGHFQCEARSASLGPSDQAWASVTPTESS